MIEFGDLHMIGSRIAAGIAALALVFGGTAAAAAPAGSFGAFKPAVIIGAVTTAIITTALITTGGNKDESPQSP